MPTDSNSDAPADDRAGRLSVLRDRLGARAVAAAVEGALAGDPGAPHRLRPGALAHLRRLVAAELVAVERPDGGHDVRRRGTGEAPGAFVAALLRSPEFAMFLELPHRGGHGPGRATAPPPPPPGPRTYEEAVYQDWERRQRAAADVDDVDDDMRGFGFGPPRGR